MESPNRLDAFSVLIKKPAACKAFYAVLAITAVAAVGDPEVAIGAMSALSLRSECVDECGDVSAELSRGLAKQLTMPAAEHAEARLALLSEPDQQLAG